MKKILLFVAVNLTVWLGLISCENHTDEFDNSPKVGSILLSDGTVVSSEGFKADGLSAVGVIFYVKRDTILVVGTKELGSYAYADSLVQRYENPELKHRTWQIAMDGSQKLPQRMLDSIRWHIKHGDSYDFLALGVAGWMRYVKGVDEKGEPIEISDPIRDEITQVVAASAEGEARVQALLSIKSIFGEDLKANQSFVNKVTTAYLTLLEKGAKAAVNDLVIRYA